jgi:hypothetical protein
VVLLESRPRAADSIQDELGSDEIWVFLQCRECVNPLAIASLPEQLVELLGFELPIARVGPGLPHLGFQRRRAGRPVCHRATHRLIGAGHRGCSSTNPVGRGEQILRKINIPRGGSDVGLPSQAKFKISPAKRFDALPQELEFRDSRGMATPAAAGAGGRGLRL